MRNHQFAGGMGLGMIAGATLGIIMATREKTVRHTANSALKTMGEAMENLSDALRM